MNGLRIEREAASNTASTFVEHIHIIHHMFRFSKSACANTEVGTRGRAANGEF